MNVRVLILGGTAEARELAEALVARGVDVVTSLAGVTRTPAAPAGTTRIGGFGGASGLAKVLARDGFAALIDATHPFAAGITANALTAAAQVECPLLVLRRPGWEDPEGAEWWHVPDLTAAVDALPSGARALMTTGAGSAHVLINRPDVTFVLRSIEPVPDLPSNVHALLARPPFPVAAERALMRDRGISHLVAKNSGGALGRSKLLAAQSLGLPVIMIARPPVPEGPTIAAGVAEALDWLGAQGLLDTRSGAAP